MVKSDLIQGYIDSINWGMKLSLPQVDGYSSAKVRMLLHLLVNNVANHYLEIGVHLGSTFIPAIYKSTIPVTCIDNWSRFGNLRSEFVRNLELHGLLSDRVQIFEQDCFLVDLAKIEAHGGPVDVYFYDGDHEPPKNPQYKAVDYFMPILADNFIMLVDDANYPGVVEPTRLALSKNKIKIIHEWTLPGPYNGGPDEWWNGLFVFIGEKA